MTQEALLAKFSAMVEEDNEDILLAFLRIAAGHVLRRAYPFRADVSEVPEKYQTAQLEIAVYLYNKQGAEGETAHSENGVNRTYESASVPDSLLKSITPYAGVF